MMDRQALVDALGKVVERRVENRLHESNGAIETAVADVMNQMQAHVAQIVGRVAIKSGIPDVSVTNEVQSPVVQNTVQVDLAPLAAVIADCLAELGRRLETALSDSLRENMALQKQTAEAITAALRALPAPQIEVKLPPVAVPPATVTVQPAPVPEPPKREIVIERRGDKMYVSEV